MTQENELRDRLLALDATDTGSEQNVQTRQSRESEIKTMFEQNLSMPKRIMYALLAVFFGLFAVVMLNGALSDELPWLVRMIAWYGLAGMTAMSLLFAFFAIRGRWHRRRHGQLLMFIAAILLTGMGVSFLLVGAEGDPTWNNVMLQTTGWIFMGLLAVTVLMHRMEEERLKTHVKLLELELRLAQIAERLEKR